MREFEVEKLNTLGGKAMPNLHADVITRTTTESVSGVLSGNNSQPFLLVPHAGNDVSAAPSLARGRMMQTEHFKTGAPLDVQIDEKGRLYVNDEPLATKLDLNWYTLIPLWIAALGAALQGTMAFVAYVWLRHLS